MNDPAFDFHAGLSESSRQVMLGDARITLLCLGAFECDLTDWFPAPPRGWPRDYQAAYAAPFLMPMICVHAQMPGGSVLIDACDPRAYALPGTTPKSLTERLGMAGIAADGISDVIVTHGHHDHFCGLWDSARDQPTLTKARHFLASPEWHDGRLSWLAKAGDDANTSDIVLRNLDRTGRLTCLPGAHSPVPGITVFPTPGESPGHVSVVIDSNGQRMLVLGDLYHHVAEFQSPDLSPRWANAQANLRSRKALLDHRIKDSDHLVLTHIFPVLRTVRGKLVW